jgi:hypothetical protein
MDTHGPELSSIEFQLEELERRVHAITQAYEGAKRADVLAALYEAERALKTARAQVLRAESALG